MKDLCLDSRRPRQDSNMEPPKLETGAPIHWTAICDIWLEFLIEHHLFSILLKFLFEISEKRFQIIFEWFPVYGDIYLLWRNVPFKEVQRVWMQCMEIFAFIMRSLQSCYFCVLSYTLVECGVALGTHKSTRRNTDRRKCRNCLYENLSMKSMVINLPWLVYLSVT
jgi:hypothetical protein